MESVNVLQGVTSETKKSPEKHGQTLGKQDFLNLLVSQLKNQDPLNPSDPTEFTAQLAQYSSLEQLYNINDSMQGLSSLQDGFGRLSALSMIDKTVLAESDGFHFAGEPVELGFRFQEPVQQAVVSIKNETGQIVDQIEIAQPETGDHLVKWDGTDQNGQNLAKGAYSLDVIGTTAKGTAREGTTLVESRISGVDFSKSDSTLLTANGPVKLSEISRVNNPTGASTNQD